MLLDYIYYLLFIILVIMALFVIFWRCYKKHEERDMEWEGFTEV
jgi:hypothetical protein